MDSKFLRLREALEASWDELTSYKGVKRENNIAYGQCYPTSRVVQHFYPTSIVLKGKVWTGSSEETHFWNAIQVGGDWLHVDFSWQQFPEGSRVMEFAEFTTSRAEDGPSAQQRCALLLQRVQNHLMSVPSVSDT